MSNNSELAEQFGSFTRQLVGMQTETAEPARKSRFLGIL
jgi:hypothetical protein